MTETAVAWAPQDGPQEAMVACPVEEVCYGGARGGGKTYGLLGDVLIRADRYGVDFRGIIFRRSFTPELEEIITQTKMLFPKLGWLYNAGTYTWTAPNGATLLLRHLDNDADADLYQGHQYCWQGFDEVGNFPDPAPIDKLWGSLRSPAGVPCVRRLTCNPGGPGHHWVEERYRIINGTPYEPFWYTPQAKDHPELRIQAVFIPAKLEDNPALMKNDPEYERRLAAVGSAALYKAWRYGDWTAVVGAVFTEWNVEQHVLAEFDPPKGWTWGAGMDWGYRAPGWFGLFACGPDGDTICVQELSFKEQTDYQVGYAVGLICRSHGMTSAHLLAGDDQMWQKTGVSSPTIAEGFQVGLFDAYGEGALDWAPRLVPAEKGKGSRAAKLVLMHEYLRWSHDKHGKVQPWMRPKLRFVGPRCPVAVKTIPTLPVDPNNAEDVDTTAVDHAYDGVASFLMSRPPFGERQVRPEHPEKHPGLDRQAKRRVKMPEWEKRLRQQAEDDGGTHFRMPRGLVEADDL